MRIPGPENGLVIRYDFLWKHESDQGQEQGAKDRPCAVVLAMQPDEGGARNVIVCPITHTPPDNESTAVELPPRVARHLGLDAERSWIRTHQVNTFKWFEGMTPAGVVPADKSRPTFGHLPPKLYTAVRDQVSENSKHRHLHNVRREDETLDKIVAGRSTQYSKQREEQLARIQDQSNNQADEPEKSRNGDRLK